MNLRAVFCALTLSLLVIVPANAQSLFSSNTSLDLKRGGEDCDPKPRPSSTPKPYCPPTNAVPEPSTLALALLGLLPLARRRK